VQTGARVRRFGRVTTLEHTSEIEHPWPRAFRFTLELMVEEAASPAAIDDAYRTVGGGADVECVVNLFGADAALVEALAARGFVHAFDKVLMAKALGPAGIFDKERADLRTAKVDTMQLVEQSAVLGAENRSHAVMLGDRHLHDFLAFRNDAIVASAQLVTTDLGVAYIGRMFTVPEHRRTGCCRALLDTAHAQARELGMTHAVLVPSLMAWEARVYQACGYETCRPMSLLVRARPPG